MKKVASLTLSFLICFAAVPWNGFAVQTAPVTGTVTDSKGSPIANAKVVATDDQGSVVGTATTDAQGQYSMLLPVGAKYTLTLEPPAPFEKPAEGVTLPLLAAAGAVANLGVGDPGGITLLGLGVGAIAGSAGAAVGAASPDKKKVGTPSN